MNPLGMSDLVLIECILSLLAIVVLLLATKFDPWGKP